jgi:RNA polymerase sigma-70 factor (ECF subfamily)
MIISKFEKTRPEQGRHMVNAGESSFEDVYDRHYQNVFRTAYHLMKNRDDAKDITQEVFVRFIQSRKTIRNHDGIKSWLHRVTVNCAIDLIKKRGKKLPNTEESGQSKPRTPEEGCLQKETHYLLLRELDHLPEKQKQALILRFFEGCSISEIAKFVGLTNGSTRVTITRALLKLRKRLFKKRGLFHV